MLLRLALCGGPLLDDVPVGSSSSSPPESGMIRWRWFRPWFDMLAEDGLGVIFQGQWATRSRDRAVRTKATSRANSAKLQFAIPAY